MTANQQFQPGEIVDIAIKGVRVFDQDQFGRVGIDAENPGTDIPGYYLMPAQAAITRIAPAEWPPQPADLWRDREGNVWFGVDIHEVDETDEPKMALFAAFEGYSAPPDIVNQRSGPMALVRREQQDAAAGLSRTNPTGDPS